VSLSFKVILQKQAHRVTERRTTSTSLPGPLKWSAIKMQKNLK